jgi:ribonuclease J
MSGAVHPHPDLGVPPALKPGALRIVALGGLGEIGRNMTVFEFAGRLLIVDCGVLFPEEDQPGVDLILPDFGYLEDRLDDIEAVVLTHGHEDHIGAVPYLLRLRRDIPVYGSTLTLALVAAKLREFRIDAQLNVVAAGDTRELGPFGLRFVAVNHSIPDALAVAITTDAGVVVHTGDFKMDQLPLDGRITDLNALARLGDEGVDLLLVDSTNAEVPGFVRSEREIQPVLNQVFAESTGKIVVACFASHIHRVQQVLDAAAAHKRKVAFVGRSMVRTMNVARDLGYLRVPGDLLVNSDRLADFPDDEVVLVCTGSQGEPMAALSRIAHRDHKIEVGPGDTVVLASSMIPGNENAVNRVINGLTRLGSRVVHQGNAFVHVSGHAAAGELLYIYNILKPRNVMPVHGEPRHLRANAALAVTSGVAPESVVIADDGTVVDLEDGIIRVVGAVPCGYIYVDGASVGDITEAAMTDRRILGEEGFISVFVVVDAAAGKVAVAPQFHARGFSEDPRVFESVAEKVKLALEDAMARGDADRHQLQQVVRRTVGRWVSSQHRRRPMILPVVVEE